VRLTSTKNTDVQVRTFLDLQSDGRLNLEKGGKKEMEFLNSCNWRN